LLALIIGFSISMASSRDLRLPSGVLIDVEQDALVEVSAKKAADIRSIGRWQKVSTQHFGPNSALRSAQES
jgi:hypothetical protein